MLWDKIQKQLDKGNKTAYWLSKKTGISESMIYALRKGSTKEISFNKVIKIADALGVDINEFREEKENE